jgi:hypothetical protein
LTHPLKSFEKALDLQVEHPRRDSHQKGPIIDWALSVSEVTENERLEIFTSHQTRRLSWMNHPKSWSR